MELGSNSLLLIHGRNCVVHNQEEIMEHQSPTSGNYPLDNMCFDLIAIIYEKSKALEAYGKYLADARGDQTMTDLLGRMRRQDEDCVEELRQRLGDLLTQNRSQGQQAGI